MKIEKLKEIIKNFWTLDYNEFKRTYNFNIEKETFDFINWFEWFFSGDDLIELIVKLKDNNEIYLYSDGLVEICNENGYEIKGSNIHQKIKIFLIELLKETKLLEI